MQNNMKKECKCFQRFTRKARISLETIQLFLPLLFPLSSSQASPASEVSEGCEEMRKDVWEREERCEGMDNSVGEESSGVKSWKWSVGLKSEGKTRCGGLGML